MALISSVHDEAEFIYKLDSKTGEITKHRLLVEERVQLIRDLVKLPGEQNLDERIYFANKEATNFLKTKLYCNLVPKTRDWISYWELQKSMCYAGLLIDEEIYICGDEYWYLNFIQIPDKVKKKTTFPRIFDTDIWTFAMMELADLTSKYTACVKKRQIGHSLKLMAKVLKRFWFEQGFVGRIASWDEKYVKDNWTILELYKDHLNGHTGWKRHLDPDSTLLWNQRIKMEDGTYKGNKSILQGLTFNKKPTKVVGGKVDMIIIDEAGIAPNLDELIEFANAALKFGDIVTGNIHIAGAVGQLKDCQPLETLIKEPDNNNVLSFPNLLSGKPDMRIGMFIPQQYSYGTFIDEYGNSLVTEALIAIGDEYEEAKKKSYKSYITAVSQGPRNIEEAFANREENIFPTDLLEYNKERLEEFYKPLLVTLYRDENNRLKHRMGSKYPLVEEWPVNRNTIKNGAIVMDEAPLPDAPFGLYYAGVDTITPIKSESISLQSIHIFKAAHEISGEFHEEKLVAWFTGRSEDDPYETYRICLDLIQYYNARAAVENNNRNFIEWMIGKKQQKYLMTKNEMPLAKEFSAKVGNTMEYGLWMSTDFKEHLYTIGAEYMEENIGARFNDETGESVPIKGVTRINDYMLNKEFLGFTRKRNVDRVISFLLGLFAARANTSRGMKVSTSETLKTGKKSVNYSRVLANTALAGGNSMRTPNKMPSPFKR